MKNICCWTLYRALQRKKKLLKFVDLVFPFSFFLSWQLVHALILQWQSPLRINFLFFVFLVSQQSKDKICEKNIDTTETPPYSSTALLPTTTKFRVLTTTRGSTTSHLPTSLPTEGDVYTLHYSIAQTHHLQIQNIFFFLWVCVHVDLLSFGQWKEWGISVKAISATAFKLPLALTTVKGTSAGGGGSAWGAWTSQADFWATYGCSCSFNHQAILWNLFKQKMERALPKLAMKLPSQTQLIWNPVGYSV